jgi:hypothetical protein
VADIFTTDRTTPEGTGEPEKIGRRAKKGGTAKQAPEKRGGTKLTLVHRALPTHTIEILERLLKQAKAGQLTGLTFAAMYRRGSYMVATTDEANRNPTFARGMVAALDDHLAEQQAQRFT